MNFLSTALHGSTTMVSILIGQIIVVASLALMTIWLLVRRARFGPPPEVVVAPQFVGMNPTVGASADSGNSSALIVELENKCTQLQAENSKLVGMRNEYQALQEKVKFLESKLLEYEILQEEIGTLSMLKLENEKLKKEISKLQAEIQARVDNKPTPLVAEEDESTEAEAAGEKAESTEAAAPPQATAEAPPAPPAKEPAAAPAAKAAAPAEEAPEPSLAAPGVIEIPAQPTAAAAANIPPVDPGGLDGLLNEIEALTADLGKDNQPKP